MAKESMPFELKRPNAGTPVTNASEIDYGNEPLDKIINNIDADINGSDAPETHTFSFDVESTSSAFNTLDNPTAVALEADKNYILVMQFSDICTEMLIRFFDSLGETIPFTFNGESAASNQKRLTPLANSGVIVLESPAVSFGLYVASSKINNVGTFEVTTSTEGAASVGLKEKVTTLQTNVQTLSGTVTTANAKATAAENYINNNRTGIAKATGFVNLLEFETTAGTADNLYNKEGDFERGNINVNNGNNSGSASTANAVRMIGSLQLEANKSYNVQLKALSLPSGHLDLRVFGYDANGDYVGYDLSQYKYNAVDTPALVHITPESGYSRIRVAVVYWYDYFEEADLPIMIYESDTSASVIFKEYTTEGTSVEVKNLIIDYRQIKNAPKTTQQTPSGQGEYGNVAYVSPARTNFDGQILKIAYSVTTGVNGQINTMTHFRDAVAKGFTALKTDMHITSDGVIVLCHDCGFCFNSSTGKIKSFVANDCDWFIHEHTAAEVAELRRSDDDTIATLEEFLQFCKIKGVTPLLTLRNSPYYGMPSNHATKPPTYSESYVTLVVAEVTRLLAKYRLTENAIINCFPRPAGKTVSEAAILRQYLPDTHIVFMNNSTTPINEACVRFAIETAGNNIVGAIGAEEYPEGTSIDMFADDTAIQYAIDNNVPLLAHTIQNRNNYLAKIAKGVTMFFVDDVALLDWD